MLKITTHFSWPEANCKDGTSVPENYKANVALIAAELEVIRHALDDKPLIISSWYRSLAHNKEIGGCATSLHLQGLAADIHSAFYSSSFVFATIFGLIKSGVLHKAEIGLYNNFVHYGLQDNFETFEKVTSEYRSQQYPYCYFMPV